MDWLKANQQRTGIEPKTVAELIDILKKCPQDWPIHNADSEEFCEINVVTDGEENEVMLY